MEGIDGALPKIIPPVCTTDVRNNLMKSLIPHVGIPFPCARPRLILMLVLVVVSYRPAPSRTADVLATLGCPEIIDGHFTYELTLR